MNRAVGPRLIHQTVRLTGLTRAHTTALVTAAAEAGERVFTSNGRWVIVTPEHTYIGGHCPHVATFIFGDAWESPLQWLDRHIDQHPAPTRVGRLLRTVREQMLATTADCAA